jgi:hypothetical protein
VPGFWFPFKTKKKTITYDRYVSQPEPKNKISSPIRKKEDDRHGR